MSGTETLPRWNLETIFPGLDSPEFAEAFEKAQTGVAALRDKIAKATDGHDAEALLEDYNSLADQLRRLMSYVHGKLAVNSRDEAAQKATGRADRLAGEVRVLWAEFVAWFGSHDFDVQAGEVSRAHAFAIERLRLMAQKQMAPGEEKLAAELGITGSTAWSHLWGNLTSQLMARVELPDGPADLPMSAVRNLATDPNPEVRRAAYEAELEAWKSSETALAACMNGIKGEVLTLTKKRGWDDPLSESLFHAAMDTQTLEALLGPVRESFPTFRRYMRAKARRLGHPNGLPWWELFAPVATQDRAWSFEDAAEFVETHFRGFSPELGDLAARSYREEWIDVPPAEGKRDGAFCMSVRAGESRVLMNFKPSFRSVSTLSHELGHAYHNLCLGERTALQRTTPMTLAETASIFCETIVKRSALEQMDGEEALAVLEATLQSSSQVVVDVYSRFTFEKSVFEARKKGPLQPRELCELMSQAQADAYGDGLAPDSDHPYMWAVKTHYYSTRSYYNFPYIFGLLFGLGLYAQFDENPEGFQERYRELLSSTGLSDAPTLAAKAGLDIRDPEFWRGGLRLLAQDVERFERMVQA